MVLGGQTQSFREFQEWAIPDALGVQLMKRAANKAYFSMKDDRTRDDSRYPSCNFLHYIARL